MELRNLFTEIYLKNIWDDPFSRSGTGSNLEQTKKIRKIIPDLIDRYKVNSMLDIPCGDFFWMQEIKPQLTNILKIYIGGDIVPDIIRVNKEKYEDGIFNFQYYDLLNSNLPKSDLIFCRDCLVHFSYEDILKALINIKNSKSTYLLTTTFTSRKNRNIITGGWRPINLTKFPFFLNNPLEIFSEDCSQDEGKYRDKSIALWEIKNLSFVKLRILVFFYSVYKVLISKAKMVRKNSKVLSS